MLHTRKAMSGQDRFQCRIGREVTAHSMHPPAGRRDAEQMKISLWEWHSANLGGRVNCQASTPPLMSPPMKFALCCSKIAGVRATPESDHGIPARTLHLPFDRVGHVDCGTARHNNSPALCLRSGAVIEQLC